MVSLVFLAWAGRAPAAEEGLPARIAKLAASLTGGHEAPRLDGRLSAAAADLAALCPSDDTPPGGEIIGEALELHGVIEPAPNVILGGYGAGDEEGLLREVRRPLREALAQGRWRRLGVGTAEHDGHVRVLLLLLESYVEMEGPPRTVSRIGSETPVPLRGRLLPPYHKPEVLVTGPDGKVARLPLSQGAGDAETFDASFLCLERGRYQVEVLGEDRSGSTVLANFPIYCAVTPPDQLRAPREAAEQPFRTPAEAAQQLLALLNGDRARFGLPALAWDERLAQVAAAHSADMRARNTLGHVSPVTGDAAARLRRAGVPATVILENLARAYSPREVERGLMDSPGHRANLLSPAVTRVGIGVDIAPPRDGVRELWATQLFAKPAEPFDPRKTPPQALARIQQLRQGAGQPPLVVDAALGQLAQQTADELGQGKLSEEQVGGPAERALPALSSRFRALRTVLAVSSDVSRLSSSPGLLDPAMSHLGLGLAPVPPGVREEKGAPGTYVVMVLGSAAPRPGRR